MNRRSPLIFALLIATFSTVSLALENNKISAVKKLMDEIGFDIIFENINSIRCSHPDLFLEDIENLEVTSLTGTILSLKDIITNRCPEVVKLLNQTMALMSADVTSLIDKLLGKSKNHGFLTLYQTDNDKEDIQSLQEHIDQYKLKIGDSLVAWTQSYTPASSLCSAGGTIDFVSVTFDSTPIIPASGVSTNNLNYTGKANSRVDLKKGNMSVYCGDTFYQNTPLSNSNSLNVGDLVTFSFPLKFPSYIAKGTYKATIQISNVNDDIVSCVVVQWTM